MRHQLNIVFLFLTILTWGQNNIQYKSLQLFDKDSVYHELTISEKHIYIYTDSSTVDRLKIKRKQTKLIFGHQTWFLDILNDSTITISVDGNKLKVYKANYLDKSLVHFYEWYNADNRNGNGVMILYRDATERKLELLKRTKNAL